MKSVVNANKKAADKSAVQEGRGEMHLPVSWHVAPAQQVAILDLTGQAGDRGLSPVVPNGPVAPARLQQAPRHQSSNSAGKN